MELLDSIRNERFTLEMMHDYLRSLSTRIYGIDYRPLETLDDLDTVDLINFKRYIDSRFESLLETYHLKKNGRYDDSSFYIKTDLIRFRQSMTFKEFIDENFSRIYANAGSVNMIDYDSDDIDRSQRKDKRYKAPVYKECEDELSMLRDFSQRVKDVVDSFDDFSEALDQLNSEILEEFELNRDNWHRDLTFNTLISDSAVYRMKHETISLLCRLFALMHKHYSPDRHYLNTLSRSELENLYEEMDRFARKHGLEIANTYYDNSFDLKPLNLSESDLTVFMKFIMDSEVLDQGLREYVENKDISDNIIELNRCTSVFRESIKMFKDFEDAFEQFNDKLLKRVGHHKKALIETSNALTDDVVERIENLTEALECAFYQLRRKTNSVYKVYYHSIKTMTDVDIEDFEHFKNDIDLEIDRILSSYKLRKDKISTITDTFELNPVKLAISKDMSLLEFVDANLTRLHCDTMFIDSICRVSSKTLSNKILTLVLEKIMTEKDVEKEFKILIDFIESINGVTQAYDDFRTELDEINASLVDEYKQTYCR